MAPTPEIKAAVHTVVSELMEALEPWQSAHTYMNFAESRRDPRTLWTEAAHRRLKRIKDTVDPEGVIVSNHPL